MGAEQGDSKGQGNRDKMPRKRSKVACSDTASGQANKSCCDPSLVFDPCTQLQAQDLQWEGRIWGMGHMSKEDRVPMSMLPEYRAMDAFSNEGPQCLHLQWDSSLMYRN